MPQQLFSSLAAFLLGAHGPHLKNLVESRIEDTHLRLDVYKDALGVAILLGDRWRRSHDALKDWIFVDGHTLEIDLPSEVYGLFTIHPS